ncbi:hypothetical protein E1B28_009554 [Marasmius oreades]|uniref:Uncharacterized protein n=1 Tax=Marasmius oreades TaxID=181124 RepID=A0A9P7RVI9_9AGAR|nr:uncharacterized protein E1B28_009554 [Marasmius oreades]KAG7090435.1 hypothetical protein E1B28_009554 [Marasmius oreades]
MVVLAGGVVNHSRFHSASRGHTNTNARLTRRQDLGQNSSSLNDPTTLTVASPKPFMDKLQLGLAPTATTAFNESSTLGSSSQPPSTTSLNMTDGSFVQTQTRAKVPATSTESNLTMDRETELVSKAEDRDRIATSTTTSWFPTEDAPNPSTLSSTPSPLLVRVSTTLTEPMVSRTTMTTEVTHTSVVTGDNRDSKKNTPVIVGIVICSVALLSLLICALVLAFRRYMRRRQSSGSDGDASSASMEVPPPSQSQLADKLQIERERTQTLPAADPDHQEATGRNVGEQEDDRGQLNSRRESVISSGDSESIVGIPDPPPAYAP